MASDTRSRSPQDGARRRREFSRSPYVTLGAVRYAVRRAPPPRACPCRCCSEEAVAACLGRAKPDRRTLDRFQRRLGRGARDERPSRHQRLLQLTERLLPRSNTAPPLPNPPPPPPQPPPHSAPVLPPVPPPRSKHRHSPPRGVSVDRYDDFDVDNIPLVRVEPRSIVGSYAQKTIPYRSASFSQGDFSPDKYYRRQPSIFDFGKRTPKVDGESTVNTLARRDAETASENVTEGGSVASVDSAVGSDEGLLAHVSPDPRSTSSDVPHKQLGARSLTHPLPRRIPPVREEGPNEAGGSLPVLMAPRVLHELREESDGSQADSAQAHSEGTSPLEPAQPFAFPPLPDPPANACVNVDCECVNFPVARDDSTSELAKTIPVPVYECIVKQWSKELPQEETLRSDAASDGSLDRDKEDETITSEQVASLLAAVKNPCTPAPIGARERRRPLDKTKRRKGIYITTVSDDGGEDEGTTSINGCKRESSEASLQDMRLSSEARTSSLLGDKSDDSFTNGPPSPCEEIGPIWNRSEDLKTRRARFSHQSSDERDEDMYRTRRKYGVISRGDSPSEADSDSCSRDRTASPSPFSPSDLSDVESKRQQFTRKTFGRNLEAPITRSVEVGRRSFSDATVPCRKASAGISASVDTRPRGSTHKRATSSPSKLAGVKPGADLLAELLRGSSEILSNPATFDNVVLTLQQHNDTRTHVVVELYETEKSYVEALDILVKKYLHPLKSPENAGLLEPAQVDVIFFQVPKILNVHQGFLEQLRRRLEQWDMQQKVGDVFMEVYTKPTVMETYMLFINNLKKAKETIKTASTSRPLFAKFLDNNARDHKGKLSLDNLLIKPVQKFPSYKLLVQRLIKHTDQSHPDHKLLIGAQKEIHNLLELINCTERESLELEQQQQNLRDLEQMIEGLSNLVSAERMFIRYEAVTMPSAQGSIKDRALFLCNDLLLVTSVKRRTGTIKKPISTYQSNLLNLMEGNKYKLLMRINLADLEIVNAKDENVRRIMEEVITLNADIKTLTTISENVAALHMHHTQLEEIVRDALHTVNKRLSECKSSDSQLGFMELCLNTASGPENLTIIFPKAERRSRWEKLIYETKQKLCTYSQDRSVPEFLSPVPIRKTRAGLQFTCAAPTLPPKGQPPDVWVCNSDGYVGQVCVLTLAPRADVSSCNGVCNARILCVACVPPHTHAHKHVPSTSSLSSTASSLKPGISVSDPDDSCKNIRLDSSSSSDEDDDGSSTSENQDAHSERSQDLSTRLQSSLSSRTATLTPNHSKSLSTPHTGQNIQVHPVMKSNSNPAVDKQAMGISSGTFSSPNSRQSSEDSSTMGNQPTMWLGTEDGCIHVYNCQDNIRTKKNKIKLQHSTGVQAIVYMEGKVFVALANGDLVVYSRDIDGSWSELSTIAVGSPGGPVSSMLRAAGKLWCAAHSHIHIVDPDTMQVDETFQISSESKPISHMAVSRGAIWLSLHNAAQLRCFNATSREQLAEINITPQVTKMLHGCDDIIRQHKAACLRVTALLAHKDTLWVGTSAGVLLTASLHNSPNARTGAFSIPQLNGVPYGHTGHVRFLTIVENPVAQKQPAKPTQLLKTKALSRRSTNVEKLKQAEPAQSSKETLIISGGDGYEDFRSSSTTEDAGREDSTNHLLLWRV